jgi:hypothetical protein
MRKKKQIFACVLQDTNCNQWLALAESNNNSAVAYLNKGEICSNEMEITLKNYPHPCTQLTQNDFFGWLTINCINSEIILLNPDIEYNILSNTYTHNTGRSLHEIIDTVIDLERWANSLNKRIKIDYSFEEEKKIHSQLEMKIREVKRVYANLAT